MGSVALVLLVVGAVATVLLVVAVATVLGQRLARAYREATLALQRLEPALEALQETSEVTGRELERLARSRDALAAARQTRRRR